MKVLFWNVRGLANSASQLALNNFCLSNKFDFLFISEPWMDLNNIPISYWNSLRLKCFAVNDRGMQLPNLWGLCRDSLNPDVISVSRQYIICSALVDVQKIHIVAAYASTSQLTRRDLWHDLSAISSNLPGPWLYVGNFNAILGSHDQRGGRVPSTASCEDFKNWTDSCLLTHLPTRGAEFTWSNRRCVAALTERRLDRSICNDEWFDFWSFVYCTTLTRTQSDHYPTLVVMNKAISFFPSSFKFQSM